MIRFISLLVFCLMLAACGSPEERVAAYLLKAEELFAEEQYQDARLEVANALQIEPKNARARLLAAKIAVEENQLRSAFEALQIAVDVDSNLLEARILLGEIYYLYKMADEIEEQLSVAEQIAPADPEVLLLRSRVLSLRGDYIGALAVVSEAASADPQLLNAAVFKASLLTTTGDPEGGIAFLQQQIDRGRIEETERLRNFLIILLEGAGRNADVESVLRSLAGDFPDDDRYTETLVGRFIRQGRMDEAEAVLEELAGRSDDSFKRRLNLLGFVATQRSTEAAMEMTRLFLQENPESAELHLILGQLYDSDGRVDDALVTYGKVVEIAPSSDKAFEARNRIVSIYFRQGDPDAAFALITEILDQRPDNVDALLARAAFNYTDGKFDAVVVDARIALRKNPQSREAMLFRARGHAQMGDDLLAQEAYRQLLVLDPLHPEARNELAALFLARGDVEFAEELWRERLEAVESRIGLIRILVSQGKLVEAEKEARNLTTVEDSDPRGYLELGQVLRAAGKEQEAISIYRQALDLAPGSAAAIQGLVAALISTDDSVTAIKKLNGYIEKYPNQPGVRLLLANTYNETGDRTRAEQLYEALTTVKQPTIASMAYRQLAVLYGSGSAERIDVLARGVAAFPVNGMLSVFLAQEYQQSGQLDMTINTYEAALMANSSDELVANNLASVLLDLRSDSQSRLRALDIAMRFRDSEEAPYLDTLGWAYYQNADYPNAVRYLETAVSIAGQIPVLHYHLGMAYVENGNHINARQALERAISMSKVDFPGIEQAKSTLAELQAGS